MGRKTRSTTIAVAIGFGVLAALGIAWAVLRGL